MDTGRIRYANAATRLKTGGLGRAARNFASILAKGVSLLGINPLAAGVLPCCPEIAPSCRPSLVGALALAERYRLEPRLLKSPEYRLRDWSFLTAIPRAFFCPTNTSKRLARVIPV